MKVNLKCFSTLAGTGCCDYKRDTTYSVNEGHTVDDLIQRAGVNRENVKIAFVNNRNAAFDTVLADGDRVGLSPATGGM
ncbi:hypothetical protein D1AOALGA4SA_10066 [Olavius algarvensis Delta 1 endosymbiont]|nr:hypothetical protein D1AOALGA4SA_10066 [Olavius algarvensis Delta 1 endosymbiont]